jgi:hypothetical protein
VVPAVVTSRRSTSSLASSKPSVSGLVVWDVFVDVARRCDLAIMPVGCPVAVTTEEAVAHLSSELAGNAKVNRVRHGVARPNHERLALSLIVCLRYRRLLLCRQRVLSDLV